MSNVVQRKREKEKVEKEKERSAGAVQVQRRCGAGADAVQVQCRCSAGAGAGAGAAQVPCRAAGALSPESWITLSIISGEVLTYSRKYQPNCRAAQRPATTDAAIQRRGAP